MCVLLDADGCIRKRPLVRRSVYNRNVQGLSKPATASNTYSDATYSNAYPDPAASNSHSDTTYSNTHSGSNAVADSTQTDSYPNGDSNGHTYGNAAGDSHTHTYSDCYSYADDHTNRHTDSDWYGHS
jgi:hypothetical protein